MIFVLEHRERAFFPTLIEFMLSGPVVPMVWQGQNIVAIARWEIRKAYVAKVFFPL